MKLLNLIPYYDDFIEIHITKDTWLFIQNTKMSCDDEQTFCTELHHTSDFETLVFGSGFMQLTGNESKKEIEKIATKIAINEINKFFKEETEFENVEYNRFVYDTLTDIYQNSKYWKQHKKEANL